MIAGSPHIRRHLNKMHCWLTLFLSVLLIRAPLTAGDFRQAPEMEFKLPDGSTGKLSDYNGKVVLLEFVLTTCTHCARTSKSVQKMYEEFGSEGFQPVAVAFNDGAETVIPTLVSQWGITYPLGRVHREVAYTFLDHPKTAPLFTPQVVFIDRQGKIRAQYGGTDTFLRWGEEENIRELVEELLAE